MRLKVASICRAFYWCVLGIVSPTRLAEEDEKYRPLIKSITLTYPEEIFRGFWSSLFLVVVSGMVGYLLALMFYSFIGCASSKMIICLQVGGALVLLWGTLFYRWRLKTWSGELPSEQVNRWIYRGMYFIGTALIVSSLALTPCIQ